MLHSAFTIGKKELRSFFSSPTGYIVIALFVIATALFLWIFPGEYNVFDNGYANLNGLFIMAPWLYLFLCPAITMRFFSEEKQQGTIELLFTKPLSKWAIVVGKSVAGWLLVVVALLPSLLWYWAVNRLADPVGNVDGGAFWGSFIGLLFLAMVYISIGVFSSAISNNQIVSFVIAAAISFLLFYGFELIGSLFNNGAIDDLIKNFGINEHYKSISRGVIDSRDIIYFILLYMIFTASTVSIISKKQ